MADAALGAPGGRDRSECRPCRHPRSHDPARTRTTLPRPERTGMRGHLTAGEAGDHGARANAKQLVITHFPDELDEQWVKAEAERSFGRAVLVAREGATYSL